MALPSFATLTNVLKIYDSTEKYNLVDSIPISLKNKDFGNITWSGDGNWIAVLPVEGNYVPILKYRPLSVSNTKIINIEDVESASFYNCTNRFIAVGTCHGDIKVWDLQNKNISLKVNTEIKQSVDFISINSEDKHLAAGCCMSPNVHLYGLKSNKLISTFILPESTSTSSLYFSTTKKNYLAASSIESTICVFDLHSSNYIFKSVNSHVGACTDIAWSCQNYCLLASVSLSKTVNLYDIRERKSIGGTAIGLPITSVEVMNTGDKIVLGCSEGSTLVYDLRNLSNALIEIQGNSGPVLAIKMEPQKTIKQYRDVLTMSGGREKKLISPVKQVANLSLIDILSPITPTAPAESCSASKEESCLKFSTPEIGPKKQKMVRFSSSPAIQEMDEDAEEPTSAEEVISNGSAAHEDSFLMLFTPEGIPKKQKLALQFLPSPAIQECDENIKPEPLDSTLLNRREDGGAGDGISHSESNLDELVAEVKRLRSEMEVMKDENAKLGEMLSKWLNKKPLFHEAQWRVDHIGIQLQLQKVLDYCEKMQDDAKINEERWNDVRAMLEMITSKQMM